MARGQAHAPLEVGSPEVSKVSKEIVEVLGGWVSVRNGHDEEEEEEGEFGHVRGRPRSVGFVGGKPEPGDIEGELRSALARERELLGKLKLAEEGEREAKRVQAGLEAEIEKFNSIQGPGGMMLTARSALTDDFPADSFLAREHEVRTLLNHSSRTNKRHVEKLWICFFELASVHKVYADDVGWWLMLCLCHFLDLQARVRELEEQLRGAVETMGSVEEASSRDMALIINDVSERADQRIHELLAELR